MKTAATIFWLLIGIFILFPACQSNAAELPPPGTTLLANPNPTLPPTWGYWVGGALPANNPAAPAAKATYEWSKADGVPVCKVVTRDQSASVQMGFYAKAEKWKDIPAGTLIHVGVKVRGSLSRAGLNNNPNVTLIFNIGPGAKGIMTTRSAKTEVDNRGKVKNLPLLGSFDWIPVDLVFPLPANTTAMQAQCCISGAVGEVEWKDPRIEVAPAGAAAAPDLNYPASFPSPEEQNQAAEALYEQNWAASKKELRIPAPDQIYAPKPALSGPHPRYMFSGLSLAAVKTRLNNPALAPYRKDLFRTASKLAAAVPPKPKSMDVEDPLREYGNRLPWIALAYLLEEDPVRKKLFLDSATAYLNEMTTWGPPLRDLPLSQFIFGIGAAYDWLYNDLPAQTRAKTRLYLIDMARFMRSPANVSAWQWRSGSNWLANHKWYNYAALAMAAAVLWGDADAPLKPGEQKLWMDEAQQVFWVVRKTRANAS